MRATGTWHGEYTYGDDYGDATGTSVPFTMSLTETWRRRIAGYVRDDADQGGQPERGRVQGRRRGRQFEFTKVFPVAYVTDDDGTMIERRKYFADEFGIELPADLPPHRIRYRGTLDDSGESLAGDWEIEPWGETSEGEPIGGGAGTFTARRVSEHPDAV